MGQISHRLGIQNFLDRQKEQKPQQVNRTSIHYIYRTMTHNPESPWAWLKDRHLTWQIDRSLANPWYVIDLGGRFFISSSGEFMFQQQFTDGMWDSAEPCTDYDETDADVIARIDLIKSELMIKLKSPV